MGESKLYSLLLWKLDLYPLGILITIENRHRYSDLIYCIWLWDLVDLENWVKIGLNLLIFPISRPCQDSYYPSNQHSFWILLVRWSDCFHTTLPFFFLEKWHCPCFIHLLLCSIHLTTWKIIHLYD